MSRNLASAPQFIAVNAAVQQWRSGEAELSTVVELISQTRTAHPVLNTLIDELLLKEAGTMADALRTSNGNMEEIQAIIESYMSSPFVPATFLGMEATPVGELAAVMTCSGRRVIAIAPVVDKTKLILGTTVLVSSDGSVIMAVSSENPLTGTTATCEQVYEDGRLLVKDSNTEVVIHNAIHDPEVVIHVGDTLRVDRQAGICLERIASVEANPFILQEIVDLPLDKVGGRDNNWKTLRSALMNSILYPERANEYGLSASNRILLYGPPGNGKTYMTRAIFSEIKRLSGRKVFLAVVKASAWESPLVGVTEANIRAIFKSLRDVAAQGHIAGLFIDEIDAVGRTRGGVSAHHSDKSLNTLLTELEGFEELTNVSVIGAVNRKDLLDSALTSRFGEEIAVVRPNLHEAREMFAVHLGPNYPYAYADARGEMIDMACDRLFSNVEEDVVCALKLRSGRDKIVRVQELMSARLITQITEKVRRNALDRQNDGGAKELSIADMGVALDATIERLSTTLTPLNAHNYIDGLDHHDTVMAVMPLQRGVPA